MWWKLVADARSVAFDSTQLSATHFAARQGDIGMQLGEIAKANSCGRDRELSVLQSVRACQTRGRGHAGASAASTIKLNLALSRVTVFRGKLAMDRRSIRQSGLVQALANARPPGTPAFGWSELLLDAGD